MMNMRHNGHRRPEEIQAEIERTRSEMDQTLTAIEQRLTPGQLVDQGLDYLKHSGARQYVQHLGESAKRDPIPLALVGVGLAWLMLVDRSRTRAAQGAPSGAVVPWEPTDTGTEMDADWPPAGEGLSGMDPRPAGERLSDAAHAVRERAGDAAHAAGARVSDMTHAARDRVSHLADTASQAAGNAKGRVVQMAGTARDRTRQAVDATRERASHVADSARQQAERVRQGYDHLVQEQPLALGALGFAIGALLGAAAPRTRREDELMGASSDRLVHDAKEAVREPLHRAAGAAAVAAEAATGAASEAWRSADGERDRDAASIDGDEAAAAPVNAGSPGTSDAGFMASGGERSRALEANERAMQGVEPRPLESGPGVEPSRADGALAAPAQPPSYASGPEFEPGATVSSPRTPENRPDDPPGGR